MLKIWGKMRKVELSPTRDCDAGYGPAQMSIFWSIPYFQSNSNILIDSHFCNKISTFDGSPLFLSNFNILVNSHICTQISTFWLIIAFSLKFQHFNQSGSPFHSNFNILIEVTFCTQISTFWSISNVVPFWSIPKCPIKFQHFDQFPLLQ